MSLLSNDRVHLEVRRAEAVATALRGWRRSNVRATSTGDTAAQALQALVEETGTPAAPVHARLAGDLLHLVVAQGDFSTRTRRQLQTMAEASVQEAMESAAEEQRLTWQLQPDERHMLVCAAPHVVLDDVAAACEQSKLRLRSVRPAFAVQWNALPPVRLGASTVVALREDSHVTVACIRGRAIVAVASGAWQAPAAGSTAFGDAAAAAFDLHVDRHVAACAFDADDGCGYLYVDCVGISPAPSSRWTAIAPKELVA